MTNATAQFSRQFGKDRVERLRVKRAKKWLKGKRHLGTTSLTVHLSVGLNSVIMTCHFWLLLCSFKSVARKDLLPVRRKDEGGQIIRLFGGIVHYAHAIVRPNG